jgi:mannose-6-phosphate isomerase-like protein (cupin superfamily)
MIKPVTMVDRGAAVRQPMRFDRGVQIPLVDGVSAAGEIDAHINVVSVGSVDGPWHVHHRVENFYLVLAGVLTLRLEDGPHELGAGTAVSIPPGNPHSASNHADVPLELLEIYTPASALPDFDIVEPASRPRDDRA